MSYLAAPQTVEHLAGELDRLLPRPLANVTGADVLVSVVDTALGSMLVGATETSLLFLEFADTGSLAVRLRRLEEALGMPLSPGQTPVTHRIEDEISRYLSGSLRAFGTPIRFIGTPFQLSVWRALTDISYGTTESYASLADRLGCPNAVRAVARANSSNRLAIVVPCHRVIGRNGKLTGYAGGLHRKRFLLDLEARAVGRPVQSSLF